MEIIKKMKILEKYFKIKDVIYLPFKYLESKNSWNGCYLYHHGGKIWYKNGKIHRNDGPALISSDGVKSWWQNNFLHRENGPAIIRPNGTKEWYEKGIKIKNTLTYNSRTGGYIC